MFSRVSSYFNSKALNLVKGLNLIKSLNLQNRPESINPVQKLKTKCEKPVFTKSLLENEKFLSLYESKL